MRACSSQSARSKIPGSRSSQRPFVSSMSSRDGREDVEDEAAAGREQTREPRAAPRRRSSSVCRCSSDRNGIDHERHALVHRRLAQVAEAQVELATPASFACSAQTSSIPRRRVDADDADAVARDRDRDPPGADAELDDRPAAPPRLLEVERHVLGDAPAPRVVEPGDRVVNAQAFTLSFACGRYPQRLRVYPAPARRRGRTLARPILTTRAGAIASTGRGPTGRISERGLAAVRKRGTAGDRSGRGRGGARRRARALPRPAGATWCRRCAACATARAACC